MKRLDKLILKSFIGPLVLTFFVVVFILLTQMMLTKMNDLVGKNLGFMVFGELMFYFSAKISERALPLAVLLSSLITFGNLGEYSELTAIKSAGISLLRILRPAFAFVVILTIAAFFNNNYVVTKTNLKAYSLMYDIRKQKPSLDIKAGTFYNGIPDYRIKINRKYPDGITIGDIIIYDHTGKSGNKILTLADSGKMYTTPDENYLMFELFNGKRFEEQDNPKKQVSNYIRNDFGRSKMVMSLASFDFIQSKEDIWTSHYYMKRINQLKRDIDSMELNVFDAGLDLYVDAGYATLYDLQSAITVPDKYQKRKAFRDSIKSVEQSDTTEYAKKYGVEQIRASKTLEQDSVGLAAKLLTDRTMKDSAKISSSVEIPSKLDGKELPKLRPATALATNQQKEKQPAVKKITKPKSIDTLQTKKKIEFKAKPYTKKEIDSLFLQEKFQKQGVRNALSQARVMKNKVDVQLSRAKNQKKLIVKYEKEVHKKYAQAFACIVMFLIGAPLGAIIKKGGLGIPVIISIAVFIVYYVFTITGSKWADEGFVSPILGVWGADLLLLPIGLVLLVQAKNDVRLLESDFYRVWITKLRARLGEKAPD